MTQEVYSIEVIAAAGRIADTFDSGCDRCSLSDLDLFEANGLMTQGIVEEPSDSLEEGDVVWFFTMAGTRLIMSIQGDQEDCNRS